MINSVARLIDEVEANGISVTEIREVRVCNDPSKLVLRLDHLLDPAYEEMLDGQDFYVMGQGWSASVNAHEVDLHM